MDEAKKAEIEEKIKNCKLKIANESAKLQRYQAQLETGKTGHTKKRVKPEQKPSKNIPKTEQTPPKDQKKEGFFEVIFS